MALIYSMSLKTCDMLTGLCFFSFRNTSEACLYINVAHCSHPMAMIILNTLNLPLGLKSEAIAKVP